MTMGVLARVFVTMPVRVFCPGVVMFVIMSLASNKFTQKIDAENNEHDADQKLKREGKSGWNRELKYQDSETNKQQSGGVPQPPPYAQARGIADSLGACYKCGDGGQMIRISGVLQAEEEAKAESEKNRHGQLDMV